MSLLNNLNATTAIIRCTYKIAVHIRDSERSHTELKKIAGRISIDLNIVGGLLNHLQQFAYRVSVNDETFLVTTINSLNFVINDAQRLLEDVRHNRSFIQRLFMKKDDYRQRLNDFSVQLHSLCGRIEGALPAITKIDIPRREFPDFRKEFHNTSEKELSFYDFSIIKNTPHSILTITFEEFHTTRCSCYMKAGKEQFILSYQLRTWSALNPTPIVLEERRRIFLEKWHRRSIPNPTGSSSSIDSVSSTQSLPPPPVVAAVADNTRKKLDFSEFFMSHDDICGMALTQSTIYIATKYEITIVSLSKQEIIAQYGTQGDGPNTFKHISYIYISSNDETNLYIVDRGQHAVHQYKIDDSGTRFEFVRRYVVIANVNQQCNLISCVIYNTKLYISDDANNCLHIFPVNGDRQSLYLTDNSLTPFSPGSLCTYGQYLYVANCSLESPGILVFNDQCQLVDWFRHHMLKEILTMDIDPFLRELFILTTTIESENGEQKNDH